MPASFPLVLLVGAIGVLAPGCSRDTTGGFQDHLDAFRPDLWRRSDGYTNSPSFHCGWRADHVTYEQGRMLLRLDTTPCPTGCSGKPFAAGEVGTVRSYGNGRLEGRLKVARGRGLVASLFLYDRESQDEIDIEILGKAPTQLQTNYFTGGKGDHARTFDLGFDASEDFHTYAIDRSEGAIRWYVDDRLVHIEVGDRGSLPTHPMAIMANFWTGHGGSERWLGGPFTYPGAPVTAAYDWIRFRPAR